MIHYSRRYSIVKGFYLSLSLCPFVHVVVLVLRDSTYFNLRECEWPLRTYAIHFHRQLIHSMQQRHTHTHACARALTSTRTRYTNTGFVFYSVCSSICAMIRQILAFIWCLNMVENSLRNTDDIISTIRWIRPCVMLHTFAVCIPRWTMGSSLSPLTTSSPRLSVFALPNNFEYTIASL